MPAGDWALEDLAKGLRASWGRTAGLCPDHSNSRQPGAVLGVLLIISLTLHDSCTKEIAFIPTLQMWTLETEAHRLFAQKLPN